MSSPEFKTDFTPQHGNTVDVAPGVQRLTAPNPGPMTFHGTNTYIVGTGSVAIIDPGPAIVGHREALERALQGRTVTHIFVTHTHMDHSPLAMPLAKQTGAVVVAEGPHRPARPMHIGEINPLEGSSDMDFIPDVAAQDNSRIEGDGWALGVIHTPGHTANHAAFELEGTGLLFSGDHVMAWSTSIVAPPDGAMSDYMSSLDRLLERDDNCYLPGHGGAVTKPAQFVRALKSHRKMRETALLDRLEKGDRNIGDMVASIYRDTDPRLHKAAALSLLAHLEDLVAREVVDTEGAPDIGGAYKLRK